MYKGLKGAFVYIIILITLIFGFYFFSESANKKAEDKATKKTFSEVMVHFDNLEVSYYEFDLGKGKLKYALRSEPDKILNYTVPFQNLFVLQTQDYRQFYNEKYPDEVLEQDFIPIKDNSLLMNTIPFILLFVFMIAIFFFLMRQTGGGGRMSSFSRANTRHQPSSGKKVTFDDVAGADEEKEELAEIVDFLKNPKKYHEIGARIPKGVLLVGPPGTGKTLLAKAVAGESDVPFFSISGSDFVEMFVGVGASRVRDLFEQAKKRTPSIIFIDEIDAVGRQRGAGLGGGHDEREQTLNQLLVEMDGFSENEGIIIIAATNRRDILDPALLRPGRFDRQVVVHHPDVKGREQILEVHTRNKILAPDVSLTVVAKSTPGFTGADLENLVNEAALLAARENKKAISAREVEEATIKVVAGPEKKSRVITEKDRKITAFHEAGHAICTYYCNTQDKVHLVTIIPRGTAAGFCMHLPVEDKNHVSKSDFEEEVIVLLGGRVAEKIVLNDISTGASHDINRATSIARNMVTRYGFSEKLGPITYGHESPEVFLGRDYSQGRNYSENVAAEIDAEIRRIIETGYEKAKEVIELHLDKLTVAAEYLLEHEKIDGDDFDKLMKGELDLMAKRREKDFNDRAEGYFK